MILFFENNKSTIFCVVSPVSLPPEAIGKLEWLFGNARLLGSSVMKGPFLGPRASMVTPWSTNAVEITRNMGIEGVERIESFSRIEPNKPFDPLLTQQYQNLDELIFEINQEPAPVMPILDIEHYNATEGLALSSEEVVYLKELSTSLNRPLTDVEVFGFSQINSEHCRHKIFNGTFILNGQKMPESLFALIKKTTSENPNGIVSAYADNVAFMQGPVTTQFAPSQPDRPSYYAKRLVETVVSLKAETHNFPTTVEPFNGAATGSGGEIRDRMAGGIGSIPLAGTAVYMTAYPRLADNRPWEKSSRPRNWLYQTPLDILIKASNGASDFGNKFGQPLIAGSLYTFEHTSKHQTLSYDKVIMLAGGIGSGVKSQAIKKQPQPGDKVILLGGDNYRIGMGGAAVSSTNTGDFDTGIELNAVQRANPEMQKRVANVIRSLVESGENPVIAIHDHGAGGHLNCFSELLENSGGFIDLDALPIGDPTLSFKELVGNESQERMGLIVPAALVQKVEKIAERERAPFYVVGEVSGDGRFVLRSQNAAQNPLDLKLSDLFGSAPQTILQDQTLPTSYEAEIPIISFENLTDYLQQVLRLEGVACKDWLTNKVDRCVGGLVAKQQCCGPLQLPLNNFGMMALAFDATYGVATSIGHAPAASLLDPEAGTRLAIAEALTNIIWAPLENGLRSVSLSANWMWACKNPGEDDRLYRAVKAASEFCQKLGINIPTGKDSLSMKQKYPDGTEVVAPGTVIISAAGTCQNLGSGVEPMLRKTGGPVYYLDLSGDTMKPGGSAFAQVCGILGDQCPDVKNPEAFVNAFNQVVHWCKEGLIVAGHDISGGGLVTTLLEMCFPDNALGLDVDLTELGEAPLANLLFSENPGIVFQTRRPLMETELAQLLLPCLEIGNVSNKPRVTLRFSQDYLELDVDSLRAAWYETSWLFDRQQTAVGLADKRRENLGKQPLVFHFPTEFSGEVPEDHPSGIRPVAAVLREKGSNSERELANALYMAGFEVRDVHMTDLISGRETLEDVRFLGAVGGFSNSDVLGSAKGWAGSFLYNEKARTALERFFEREDVLSIGICNGCQLFIELGLLFPEHSVKPRMELNPSGKHESGFIGVNVHPNHSVMLSSLAGTQLGIWISHGEGRFSFPNEEGAYHIVGSYLYDTYPGNPNGSDFNTAMVASKDGRHLALMPHLERSIFSWNWAYYPEERKDDVVTPWLSAFVNARNWLLNN